MPSNCASSVPRPTNTPAARRRLIAHVEQAPGGDRRRQALELERADLAAGEALRQQAMHRVRDQDLAGRGLIGEARGEIHRVAGDAVGAVAGAAARHDLAAGDADVHVKLTAERAAQVRHGGADRERGAHRPLRVVAVGDRGAEHRHGTVADVLVDGAAEALDQAIDAG